MGGIMGTAIATHNGARPAPHLHWAEALAPGSALAQLRDDPELGGANGEDLCRRAAWRQLVLSRARRARYELLAALDVNPPLGSWDRKGEDTAELILRARRAAVARCSPWAWFEGCLQERAWLSLHEADVEIIALSSGSELAARAEAVLHKARCALGPQDARVQRVASLLAKAGDGDAGCLRPYIVDLSRATFDALDDRYAQSRGYRNRLIRLTGVAVATVALLLAARPVRFVLGLAVNGQPVSPRGGTLELILIFGALGALVSAVPPLSKARGTRNPFGLPIFQLLAKLAMGPLFALVGVMVLQANLISEVQPAATLGALLVWATIFGAGQQAVTRFIDRSVTGLLGDGPGAAPAEGRRR